MSETLPKKFNRPRSLWLTFGVLHLLILGLLCPLIFNGQVLSDIAYYRFWALEGLQQGQWQGITQAWVYPVGAMLPIVASMLFGSALYQLAWFLMFTALNFMAVWFLAKPRSQNAYYAAYWWLGATAILGTVAVGRIDGLTAPIVITALLLLAARPYLAAAMLSLATWIKVWPAAVLFAIIVASKHRFKAIISGLVVTAAVIAVVTAGGGLQYLLGFLTAQGGRGMQLEAPFTIPGLWQAVFHQGGTYIFEDVAINTREVRGGMSETIGSIMNPLLALAALLIVILLLWALRRGVNPQQLIVTGSLALVASFIVFNKVGSPQFQLWLVAIVAVGLYQDRRQWRFPGLLMLAIAVLTTLVYPIFYVQLYELNPVIALILSLRNLGLFILLGWAIREVIRLVQRKPLAAG